MKGRIHVEARYFRRVRRFPDRWRDIRLRRADLANAFESY
jgi:hypothetical protein